MPEKRSLWRALEIVESVLAQKRKTVPGWCLRELAVAVRRHDLKRQFNGLDELTIYEFVKAFHESAKRDRTPLWTDEAWEMKARVLGMNARTLKNKYFSALKRARAGTLTS